VVLHNRGVELMKSSQYESAIVFLKEALRIQNNEVTRTQLADAYAVKAYGAANRGHFRAAKSDMEQGLRYDPGSKDLLQLRTALRRRGY
jgi:tetratricopeptide (TPR) repeat protein